MVALTTANQGAIDLFDALDGLKSRGMTPSDRLHRIKSLDAGERRIVQCAMKWRNGTDKQGEFQAQLARSPNLRAITHKLNTPAGKGTKFANFFGSIKHWFQSCTSSDSVNRTLWSCAPYHNRHLSEYKVGVEGSKIESLGAQLGQISGVQGSIRRFESEADKARYAHTNSEVILEEAYSEEEISTDSGGTQMKTGRWIDHPAVKTDRPPSYYIPELKRHIQHIQEYAHKETDPKVREQLERLLEEYQGFVIQIASQQVAIPQSERAMAALSEKSRRLREESSAAERDWHQARKEWHQARLDQVRGSANGKEGLDLLRVQLDVKAAERAGQ